MIISQLFTECEKVMLLRAWNNAFSSCDEMTLLVMALLLRLLIILFRNTMVFILLVIYRGRSISLIMSEWLIISQYDQDVTFALYLICFVFINMIYIYCEVHCLFWFRFLLCLDFLFCLLSNLEVFNKY